MFLRAHELFVRNVDVVKTLRWFRALFDDSIQSYCICRVYDHGGCTSALSIILHTDQLPVQSHIKCKVTNITWILTFP